MKGSSREIPSQQLFLRKQGYVNSPFNSCVLSDLALTGNEAGVEFCFATKLSFFLMKMKTISHNDKIKLKVNGKNYTSIPSSIVRYLT